MDYLDNSTKDEDVLVELAIAIARCFKENANRIKELEWILRKKEEEIDKMTKHQEPVKKIHPMSEPPETDPKYTICSVNVEALTQGGNWVEGFFILEADHLYFRNFKEFDTDKTKSTNCYQGWRHIKD